MENKLTFQNNNKTSLDNLQLLKSQGSRGKNPQSNSFSNSSIDSASENRKSVSSSSHSTNEDNDNSGQSLNYSKRTANKSLTKSQNSNSCSSCRSCSKSYSSCSSCKSKSIQSERSSERMSSHGKDSKIEKESRFKFVNMDPKEEQKMGEEKLHIPVLHLSRSSFDSRSSQNSESENEERKSPSQVSPNSSKNSNKAKEIRIPKTSQPSFHPYPIEKNEGLAAVERQGFHNELVTDIETAPIELMNERKVTLISDLPSQYPSESTQHTTNIPPNDKQILPLCEKERKLDIELDEKADDAKAIEENKNLKLKKLKPNTSKEHEFTLHIEVHQSPFLNKKGFKKQKSKMQNVVNSARQSKDRNEIAKNNCKHLYQFFCS